MVQTFAVFAGDPTTAKIKTVKVGYMVMSCGVWYTLRVPPYLAHDLQQSARTLFYS